MKSLACPYVHNKESYQSWEIIRRDSHPSRIIIESPVMTEDSLWRQCLFRSQSQGYTSMNSHNTKMASRDINNLVAENVQVNPYNYKRMLLVKQERNKTHTKHHDSQRGKILIWFFRSPTYPTQVDGKKHQAFAFSLWRLLSKSVYNIKLHQHEHNFMIYIQYPLTDLCSQPSNVFTHTDL